MRVKEFSITRYGPLHNSGPFSLRDFNLFWGRNEDGKTLTIDALVKLLLGRDIRDFERIDRVDENPEGYVVIEDDKGEEIKLPERGNLTTILDLTPSECRNLFVVRNSDLSIVRETNYYTQVTDRLTGLRTEQISKVKEILRDIGKITPTGMLRDVKGEKLRRRVEDAKELIEGIQGLAEEMRAEEFDELEEESVRHREEIDRTVQQMENLEDARKRETYQKGKEALDKLKEASEALKDLEIYNDDDEKEWRDCQRDVEAYGLEKEDLLARLEGYKKELKETNRELREKGRDLQVLDERKKELDDAVRPELKNYESKERELTLQEWRSRLFSSIVRISAPLIVVFSLGAILSRSILSWTAFYASLAVLSFISTVVALVVVSRFDRDRDSLAAKFESITWALSKVDLSAESIEGILANIQQFDEEYSKRSQELEELRGDKKVLENRIEELRERIGELDRKTKGRKETIEELSRKSRVESLQEYTKKLKLKRRWENSLGKATSSLESRFRVKGETLEENVAYWQGAIGDLEEYEDKARDLEYDDKTLSRLKEDKKSYEAELNKLEKTIVRFQKRLEEMEREANRVMQLEADYLHCSTSVDLRAVRDRLQAFIDEHESNRDAVLEVVSIFEDVEREEKRKVSELFGKGSSISRCFERITGGLYEEVLFSQEAEGIQVRRKDGAVLDVDKLSGGAYDQLYLSIRLGLGEKLLKGAKGFFIMDDPFVKADPDRLERQIDMLRRISQSGWQVIYFSAKGEVRNALEKDIDKGAINHVQIPGIFS